MTRRRLLSSLPAVASLGAGGVAQASFEKIDAHLRIHRLALAMFEAFEKAACRTVDATDAVIPCLVVRVSNLDTTHRRRIDQRSRQLYPFRVSNVGWTHSMEF